MELTKVVVRFGENASTRADGIKKLFQTFPMESQIESAKVEEKAPRYAISAGKIQGTRCSILFWFGSESRREKTSIIGLPGRGVIAYFTAVTPNFQMAPQIWGMMGG